MKRNADAALTLPDAKNVNRLRLPEYGVARVALVAGAKSSKCHRPAGAPAPKEEDKGTDDFHFLPEHETIELQYELDDPVAAIHSATLELFCRFREAPLWKLDLAALGEDWLVHGKHVVKWDGRVVEAPKAALKGTHDAAKGMQHDLTAVPAHKPADPDTAEFPDGYATLEHTPYKLRLSVAAAQPGHARAKTAVVWTYFQILVKKIELVLGPEEAVPAVKAGDPRHLRDKAVRKRIHDDGGLPADGSTRKVILRSNVFREKDTDMDDDTLHTAYEGLWGAGPHIPVFAKIRLADSAGAEVKVDESPKGAVALGHVRFLWDWTDPDEDVTGRQDTGAPTDFIEAAIDYHKDGTDAGRKASDHTYPKGDDCHVDRGGKRGPAAAPVFPAESGYAPAAKLTEGRFPFKVEPWKDEAKSKRRWASTSRAWTHGALKGRTGVVFQPSRMGGDDYAVSVYVAWDRKDADTLVLDDGAEPIVAPAAIRATTGKFQVWRQVDVARYVHKQGLPAPLLPGALAGVQAHFRRAWVELADKSAGANRYALTSHRAADGTTPDYDKICKARLAAAGSFLFDDELAVDAAFDHSAVGSMFRVRTYPEFLKAAYDKYFGTTAADMPGWTDQRLYGFPASAIAGADARATRLKACQTWLRAQGLDTFGKYGKIVGDWFFSMGDAVAGDLKLVTGGKDGTTAGAPDGATTIEFDFTDTFTKFLVQGGHAYDWCWYGKVVSAAGETSAQKCMIMFWEREGATGADKFSHELGHNMFLPHAPASDGSAAGGTQAGRHDDADGNCLMSYDAVRHGFCGLCQLRMRGWSAAKLDKTAAKNKKP